MDIKSFSAVAALAAFTIASASHAEVITLRSGQVGGLPGTAGQSDDIVTYLPNNPGGAAISATPFTPGDFAGAVSGPAAQVINPVFAWTPGISDTAARWINFQSDIQINPDGTVSGSGYGTAGSALYAIPFNVTTPLATGGFLNMEFAVDDSGGDLIFGGGNPDFLYVNGAGTGYSGGNYGSSTFHNQFIPFTTGLNYLYLYQRDAGFGVSGLIFSITIDVVPAPSAAAMLGCGSLALLRRRR